MAKYRNGHEYHERFKPVHDYMVTTHPMYVTWCNMICRCYNTDSSEYANYGGRGITICDKWRNSFEAFAVDMGIPPSSKHSMDRINNDGRYEPDNCRWATRNEQMRNRRIFKSNTSGATGVVKVKGGRFAARYDDNGVRYTLGRFATLEEAVEYRRVFVTALAADAKLALGMVERRARHDSTTGARGISKHTDGFVVRKTVLGVRKYLGFRKTYEEALELWTEHK